MLGTWESQSTSERTRVLKAPGSPGPALRLQIAYQHLNLNSTSEKMEQTMYTASSKLSRHFTWTAFYGQTWRTAANLYAWRSFPSALCTQCQASTEMANRECGWSPENPEESSWEFIASSVEVPGDCNLSQQKLLSSTPNNYLAF